jgi:Fic family protein
MIVKLLDFSQAVPYHTGAFPPGQLDYERILPALDDAAASLARYDARLTSLLNADLLLAPLRRQDAVSSSRMENTISTIEDVYRLEAEEDAATPDPYREARNDDVETYLYARAMRVAEAAIGEGQPISQHLIRSLHQMLLSFGRGAQKRPGAYKVDQNYIGDGRRGIVSYVPIAPEHLEPAMADLISFIEAGTLRPLLRTAIAHVEFEALHPFEDGNGRLGRMLITLMLWRLGTLSRPHFFVSGHFEQNKDEYIARMRAVSAEGDWTGWVVFFLTAMHVQAQANIATAERIIALYADMRERFRIVLNSQHHDRALDYIFGNPVFRNDRFVERSGIPAASARLLSRRLLDAGLLRTLEPSSGRRAALYAFDPLLRAVDI